MQTDALTDGADRAALAALIAHAAPPLAALAATSPEAYAPLRQALGLLPAAALPEEVALTLRTHMEDHCRHCGAELPRAAWHKRRIPWCDACRAAGVAQDAPLWSPEDWPDAPRRAWCVGQVEEAERLRAAGEDWGAWRALEAVYMAAEARGARILGVLRGFGMSSDGTGNMVAPSPQGAELGRENRQS
ncbi:MAG: hypothetical protein HGA45_39150 [Chloroflexales bacterium]|nr:hypothetical protein [Chloroflexales bacterium]